MGKCQIFLRKLSQKAKYSKGNRRMFSFYNVTKMTASYKFNFRGVASQKGRQKILKLFTFKSRL